MEHRMNETGGSLESSGHWVGSLQWPAKFTKKGHSATVVA